jgi:hypothetical protein
MAEEEGRLDLMGTGLKVKQVGVVLGLVFVVALAVVVGKEMSAEAMAVVIGVVCGMGAGIPASLLILAVTNRRTADSVRARPGREVSPVVVIQPGQPGAGYTQLPYLPPASLNAGPRDFHVVGGEMTAEVPLR